MDNLAVPSVITKRFTEDEKFFRVKPSKATGSALPIASSRNIGQKLETSDRRGIRVNRRSGAASNTGVNYENFMFLLALLRIVEDDHIDRFYIAQNVEEVGAFDDLVFLVEYKPLPRDKPLTRLFLVQLKHMTSRTVTLASLTAPSGGGNFNLKKYYNGFKSVMNNIGTFKDAVLNKCHIEDMTFIIYTNAVCDLGDNNCPADSLCRKLLETGGNASNVFSFNSTDRLKRFHEELERNKSPITEDLEGQQFLHQLVLFSNQSTTADLQKTLERKLRNYFAKEDIPHDGILHRAVTFVTDNNSMWMSSHCGVLFDVTINFQGFPVKLNSKNSELWRKIVIKHICQEKGGLVRVGKIIRPSNEYYMKRKLERGVMDSNILDDQFIIVSAPPGMGKSEFFTQKSFEIKNSNPLKYVIRENLLNHTDYLDQVSEQTRALTTIANSKLFAEDFLQEIVGAKSGTVDLDVLKIYLKTRNNMVVFLDGMDEINPHYLDTVCHIIQTIRAEFDVQLWVSTRTILQDQIKKIFDQEVWTLTEFTLDETKQFLKKYCKKNYCNLGKTEQKLCALPLFCKMLGDIINSSNLKHSEDAIKNQFDLYDKFIEDKFQVYYKKNKINTSAPATRFEIKNNKEKTMKKFEIVAVLAIFGKDRISELKWNIESECKDILDSLSEGIEYLGIVSKIMGDKPIFIHQSFAEYFCALWFVRNIERYKQYVGHPGNSRYSFPKEVDYFLSSKLNDTNSLFSLILNTEEVENSLGKYTDKFNELDPIGRDVLHYANLANNYTALKYILFNGYNLTEGNIAELDMFEIDARSVISAKLLHSWLAAKFMEYSQFGTLLGLVLLTANLQEYVFYFLKEHSRNSPLHMAILNRCKQDIIHLEEENLNCRDELGLTSLHVAVWMGDADTIKLLANHRAQYSRGNVLGVYPHQFVPRYNREVFHLLNQFYGDYMNEDGLRAEIMAEDYVMQGLPLHNAVQKKELRKYLESNNDLNSIRIGPDSKGRSVLHVVAACSFSEIIGDSLERNTLIQYTGDDRGYYPHHYAKNTLIDYRLKKCGINSLLSCLSREDLMIKGIMFTDLLNKVLPPSRLHFESGANVGLLKSLLLYSMRLKLVRAGPADVQTHCYQNVEFSVLYDVVFRSKYKPPGQDKLLLDQYRKLKNHMFREFYSAEMELSPDARRVMITKLNYYYAFLDNNSDIFKNLLNKQTLEAMVSILHSHVKLMSDDEDHFSNCSCRELLETEEEDSRTE